MYTTPFSLFYSLTKKKTGKASNLKGYKTWENAHVCPCIMIKTLFWKVERDIKSSFSRVFKQHLLKEKHNSNLNTLGSMPLHSS